MLESALNEIDASAMERMHGAADAEQLERYARQYLRLKARRRRRGRQHRSPEQPAAPDRIRRVAI